MNRLPQITGSGRGKGIAKVAFLAFFQAAAAGVAAFSTRDVFAALHDTAATIPMLALALIGMASIAIAGLRIAERVVAERVGQDYASELRLKLFEHFSRLSIRDVNQRRQGSIALRFVGDLAAVRSWVSLGIARLISSLIVLPLATLVLFLLNPALGMAASIPIVIGLATMALIAPRLGDVHRLLRSRRGGLAADMSERIPHAPELRLMGRMRIENNSLLRRTERLIEASIKRVRGAALLRAVPDATSGLAAAALLLATFQYDVRAAEAAGALAAVGLMIMPMRELAGIGDRYRAWIAARNKCVALLNQPRIVRPSAPDEPLPFKPQTVAFKHVGADSLIDIDITAEPGRRIAILGPNGAGKSTLLALAAGLETPTEGEIVIGDRAPASLTATQRRQMISYVGTRSPILAGSLRRALTMGAAKKPCDIEVQQTAHSFGLDALVDRLGGLGGKVAEAGRNMSGGEVKRLMLARAALSGSQLLLLDEPDEALGAEGPNLVLQLLDQTQVTTMLVTHSSAIARQMDEIWFVRDGRIIQTGSPTEVLDANGPASEYFQHKPAA
jgi:ATP-binding cassette subfamily B protein/ATP-binding cassette subfamily C protein CydC